MGGSIMPQYLDSSGNPISAGVPDPSTSLQGAVSYAATQDPDQYAHLLDLQKKLGIPPAVSAGNEKQIRQAADVNSIDYQKFAADNPRTTSWASNPDNAAVSGANEVHRLGGIEQNAAGMRAYTPTLSDRVSDKLLDLGQWMMGNTISREQLRQNFLQGPITRGAADVASGVAGMAGNIGSFFGWHGDGPTKQNLLQRIEANLDPANQGLMVNGEADKGNGFDWLMKNVAPMIPAVVASGGSSLVARTLGLSSNAAKVLTGLSVGAMFDVDQAGKTYTAVAGSGGSDYQARLAANRVAAINAIPNAAFGATDVTPFLRDNPLLTSIGLGGATGATGQIGQNVVTGQPWAKGVLAATAQGAAMMGGMHLGMGAFTGHLAEAVDAADQSELRARSPEKFHEALETIFAGDDSLRIPADKFSEYFQGKQMDPAAVAGSVGSTNYAEAVLSGGDVEVPKADFLAKLDPEHQKALLGDIVDPGTGLTARQHQEGLEELAQWASGGGAEKLAAETAAADAETAASPEYQAVKEDLRQRYADAGETPEVAETLATSHANVIANLARESGRTPAELMAMYNPKVTSGEAPGNERPVADFGKALEEKITADPNAAIAEYNSLANTDGGRILNTDEARELSADYRADRTRSADVHEPASQFIKTLYAKKLDEPVAEGRDPLVLFTAGGTGAGKSSSLRTAEGAELQQRADIIYDTNMNNVASSEKKIEQALASGRDVAIQYTYREPVEALTGGALPRAMRMGRTVPLDDHVATHVGSRSAMDALQAKYAGDPRVTFVGFDNSLGKGNVAQKAIDLLPKVDENGLRERLENALDAEHQAGRISDAVRNGTANIRRDAAADANARSSSSRSRIQSEPPAADEGKPGSDVRAKSGESETELADRPLSPLDDLVLHQDPIERAGRTLDSPEMAEARAKAQEAEAAGDDAAVSEWIDKFNQLRDADPRFQKVLAAREAYSQARDKAEAAPDDEELAKTSRVAYARWKQEAALVEPAAGRATPRGWFRMLPDGSFEIGKTEIGDLSTFVHEPAHAYLHMLRDLVGREGASESLKNDFAKIQEFLGAEDGSALTREQQEKWARANEQYLREGKAPSEGLKGVFQRFAVWLGSIYKKATDLGVELTPEIREVLDRMYAAEEGVNRAAREAGPRLFTSAEEAGWTEEQFKQYAEANKVSVDDAKAHILRELNEAAARDQSQSWREEVRNVRQAQTDLIDARPEYKAIRGLRKGELEDGTKLTLDKAALVEKFGEDRVAALNKLHRGLYRAEGGADPETVAELHGFGSAEEMMQALESVPRRNAAIDQATRDYMTAKHGDIRFDGTLNDKSLLALEAGRGNSLYRELRALKAKVAKMEAKSAAMRDIAIAPMESYSEAARQMIERKSVGDLSPSRYLDATRKYSREAFDALRKGDARAAAEAKHKELMNHFLFREATEAKRFVEKFEAYAKQAQGRTVQANLSLAGSDYRAQFNRLLFRYGLGAALAEGADRPLAAWADEQYENGKEPVIDPSLFNDSRFLHYRRASLEEVRNLRDALVNIKRLAYQEMHLVVNGRKIEFANAKAAMIERARQSIKEHPEPIFAEDRSAGDRARDLVGRGLAPLIRTEFLMKRLDGGTDGPWHENLWNLAADAQGVERELQEGVTKVVGDTLENISDKQRLRMQDKVTLPGWGEITRKRLISMAMNLGNEGNLDRLRKTFAWYGKDPAAVEGITKLMSREDWQLVQGLWDSLKPMGQRMNDLERRLTGLAPVMVKPTPLHLEFADGSEPLNLEGGYYPIVMDPRHSERAQQQDVNTTARNLMESGYGRASTSRGYTKERTGFAGPLLLDHEQVLTQHIAKASKDISHREFILAANRFLLDPAIQQTLRETVGAGFEKQMLPWLRTIVNDRNGSAVQGLGDLSNWMGRLRTNVVQASLAFKLSTLLLQVTHASSVFLHTTPAAYGQALVDFLAHPNEMTEQIRDLSPNEMKNRGENIDRDMRSVLQDGIGGRKVSKVIAKAGMFPVKMVDHLLSFPLWKAVYDAALARNAELPEERAHHLAMHEADGAVRMGLGSNAPKDLPAVMRKNDFWKIVTTLGGFENLKLNQIADVSYGVGRDRAAGAGGLGAAGNFTYRMLMAAIIPAVVGAYVQGKRPKDDENAAEWAAHRALLFPPETLPLLGNVTRAIDEGSDAKFTPMVNVVDKAVKAGSAAASDKEDKDWTGIGLNAGEAAGQLAGVPGTIQAARTARYWHRADLGEIDDPNTWDSVVGAPRK
jgi:hypothetical protein